MTPKITYSPALHWVAELKRTPQGRRAGNLFKAQASKQEPNLIAGVAAAVRIRIENFVRRRIICLCDVRRVFL